MTLPPSRRALLAGLALAPLPALAHEEGGRRHGDHDRARRAVAEGRVLPLAEILPRVLARVPGRVVEAEFEEHHGRMRYELHVVTPSGRVREVKVDAATGEILSVDD